MAGEIEIRECGASDGSDVVTMYPEVFPDEDLVPLVRELLVAGPEVISLVAVVDGELVGHAAFTICGTADAAGKVGLVGPLAVAPAWQRKGIGSAIMGAGFDRMADAGAAFACVLGDPAYYSRFGFEAERKITPPYPLPEEWDGAWQSLSLDDGDTAVEGTLIVPEPWRKEVLWTS